MTGWSIGDVKAELWRLGTSLHPDAHLFTYKRPSSLASISVVMVDRVSGNPNPDYEIYGFASCIRCEEMCYLGSETSKLVVDREKQVYPLCLACSEAIAPQVKGRDLPLGRVIDEKAAGA